MGHPLSQTLFTSLYIERLLWPEPKTLEQAHFIRGAHPPLESPLLHLVLRSYCIATIKACHFVHCMVTSQSYYEVGRSNEVVFDRLSVLKTHQLYRKKTSLRSFTTEASYQRFRQQRCKLCSIRASLISRPRTLLQP